MAIDAAGAGGASSSSGANGMRALPQSGAISLRKKISPEEQDKKLRDVADMYEKQFMGEMLKAMRSTVQESGLVKVSQAEKIYRDELDREHVNTWNKQGGLGLSKVIYDQLINKYGAQLGIKAPIQKPQGPINLDERTNFEVRPKSIEGSTQKVGFEFSRDPKLGDKIANSFDIGAAKGPGIQALQAPWSGTLQGQRSLGPDEYLLEMLHENGLKSQFVFRGQMMPGLSEGPIEAGGTLGLLSPDTKNFYWNVMKGSDLGRTSSIQDAENTVSE